MRDFSESALFSDQKKKKLFFIRKYSEKFLGSWPCVNNAFNCCNKLAVIIYFLSIYSLKA